MNFFCFLFLLNKYDLKVHTLYMFIDAHNLQNNASTKSTARQLELTSSKIPPLVTLITTYNTM